ELGLGAGLHAGAVSRRLVDAVLVDDASPFGEGGLGRPRRQVLLRNVRMKRRDAILLAWLDVQQLIGRAKRERLPSPHVWEDSNGFDYLHSVAHKKSPPKRADALEGVTLWLPP